MKIVKVVLRDTLGMNLYPNGLYGYAYRTSNGTVNSVIGKYIKSTGGGRVTLHLIRRGQGHSGNHIESYEDNSKTSVFANMLFPVKKNALTSKEKKAFDSILDGDGNCYTYDRVEYEWDMDSKR